MWGNIVSKGDRLAITFFPQALNHFILHLIFILVFILLFVLVLILILDTSLLDECLAVQRRNIPLLGLLMSFPIPNLFDLSRKHLNLFFHGHILIDDMLIATGHTIDLRVHCDVI